MATIAKRIAGLERLIQALDDDPDYMYELEPMEIRWFIAEYKALLESEQAADSSITLTWHVDDVLSIRPDLTSDQALQVLHRAKKFHNPEIGINWEVLNIHAGALFGDKP